MEKEFTLQIQLLLYKLFFFFYIQWLVNILLFMHLDTNIWQARGKSRLLCCLPLTGNSAAKSGQLHKLDS